MSSTRLFRAPGERQLPPPRPVGAVFVVLYMLAFMSTCLLFLAPVLVTLPLKVSGLVGIEAAPGSLALVAGTGAFLATFANPRFGTLSDRTASPFGMRRPWMLIGLGGGPFGVLVVAIAPNIAVVLAGWCLAQLFFNALLAAEIAVLADQVPTGQRGFVAGLLGMCVPIASAVGTFLVTLSAGNTLAMFLAPCAVGGSFIGPFAIVLDDRRLHPGQKPVWSPRGRRAAPDLPRDAVQLGGGRRHVGHRWAPLRPDRPSKGLRRRGALVYGVAVFVVALADDFNGFLGGMTVAGLGFGLYMAVDLALVVDVLPDDANVAKDLGVFNITGALPSSIAPVITPAILALGGGSYGVPYVVAGGCAVAAAMTIRPVRRVR